ncbi:MAG: hypothetical protein GY751_04325 [Bacteroidetes bacterium]|nr:hypothetical protein [Bacteroidota bacterium]
MFGIYAEEEEKPTYGITSQFKSFNPIWLNFHYCVYMVIAMRPMRFANKLKMIFARPGWTPDGPTPQEQIAQVDLNREKYDTKTPFGINVYIFVQFGLTIWDVVAYMDHFEEFSTFYQWFLAGLMILSMTICGGIFEKKK